MATIQIDNVKSNGTDLFHDSESFMRELSNGDLEVGKIHGGSTPICAATPGIASVVTRLPK